MKNDFYKDLAFSLEVSEDQTFNEFYYRVFPQLKLIEFVEDKEEQLKGIDKKLYFTTGKVITIDEKKRRVDYGDILLELFSNDKTKRLGWLFTCQCDFIVYYIVPKKTAYILDTMLLKMAWKNNGSEWRKQYKKVIAPNKGYNTISVAIPIEVLLEAMQKETTKIYC